MAGIGSAQCSLSLGLEYQNPPRCQTVHMCSETTSRTSRHTVLRISEPCQQHSEGIHPKPPSLSISMTATATTNERGGYSNEMEEAWETGRRRSRESRHRATPTRSLLLSIWRH